jgi:SWI/SNF-related matrix-associated actin-dependent regulator 1 of chromatin subfamily A
MQAAGTGLTLTAASVVLFAELDPVPAVVSQAEARVDRIGQREPVLIQHLVVDRSLDARIAKILVQKQDLIDVVMDGGRRSA